MGNLIDMKKKSIILEKPSGTIAITDSMTALQRKFYDAFLYVAKETLKKNPSRTEFEIPLKELKKFFGIEDKKNTYIKKIIKDLMKIITEYDILDKTQERWGAFSILPFVDISINLETKVGIVRFEIPTLVRKAMLNNQGIYGKIDLIIIRGLDSKYAVILYELLKDYENVEIPVMDIKTFRKIFGVVNKYKLFQDLKKRVLEPAVKEINENPHIEWTINYKLIKTGPKYTHIKFIKKKKSTFKQLEQKQAELKENAKVDVLLGLVPEQYRKNSLRRFLAEAVEKYPIEYIEAQIKLVNSKEGIKDYIAYLKTAINEDYANFYELEDERSKYKEILDKYIDKAKKLIEAKNLKIELKELVKDIIRIDFNRDKITEQEKDILLDLAEKI